MGSVYSNIYMNLPDLMEVQESKHVVVTLKDFLLWHDGIGRVWGQGEGKGRVYGQEEEGEGV